MDRHVVPFRCAARTHAWRVDGHLLTIRCTDKRCPDQRRGFKTIHVWDFRTMEEQTSRYEPVESGKEIPE